MDIENIRKSYRLKQLSSKDLKENPIVFFKEWFHDALNAEIVEMNAAALATASREGRPSCRMVLVKHVEENGILFFSNYGSPKAIDLEENPQAALTFWWKELERQVRFEGRVEKCSREISRAYFAKRPRASQIAATASRQSEPIASRALLEESCMLIREELGEREVPLPDNWGGFRLIPETVEFWQGREDRLHDRFLYSHSEQGWGFTRLAP